MSTARTLVHVEQLDVIAVITLDRPEKRNAMNSAAQDQLAEALQETSACRAIVLTGAGDVSFCSGVDTSERANLGAPQRRPAWGGDSWFDIQETIARHPAIFIAAVNGYALGGGLTLVNNCELAIAAEHATFGMPEITFHAFPALSGPTTLHRVLPKHAARLILTGERIDAATAERWGFVNEVVPATHLLTRAVELAHTVARADPVTLDYTKRALREAAQLPWSQSIDYGLRTGAIVRQQRLAAATNDEEGTP